MFKRFVSTTTKKKLDKAGDPRYTLIKKVLYDPQVTTHDHSDQKTPLKLSPESPFYTGPDESLHQEDLIERQWLIHKLYQTSSQLSNYRTKYNRMRAANLHLEKHYPELFKQMLEDEGEDKFPKRMRIFTDEVSKLGWDYDMDRNK